MNISSEVGLNTDVPYGSLATDMAMIQLTLKEIGDGSISQIQSPTDSNSLRPPKLCECGCGGVVNNKYMCGHNNRTHIPKEVLQELYDSGLTIRSIGKIYNLSGTSIQKKMVSAGIKARHDIPKKSKRVTSSSYVQILKPTHHKADKDGYVNEHILIVEESIGRQLQEGEIVHHINCYKKDNGAENLWVCTQSTHGKAHASIIILIKELLDRNIIEFDREKGIYIMKKRGDKNSRSANAGMKEKGNVDEGFF